MKIIQELVNSAPNNAEGEGHTQTSNTFSTSMCTCMKAASGFCVKTLPPRHRRRQSRRSPGPALGG